MSKKLLEEIDFDFVDIYLYEDRPGTVSSTMKNIVPDKIIKERARALRS